MNPKQFEKLVGAPLTDFSHQCHAASLALVRALGEGHRVARGSVLGVPGQHSWVVVGNDCYDPRIKVIDPTFWSYAGTKPAIWSGMAMTKGYRPHGTGNIWDFGRPPQSTAEPIELAVEVSDRAKLFLSLCGPLDRRGWAFLANAPVGGWPAREIIEAMLDTPGLAVLIPYDIVGMLTDRNPSGLYLPTPELEDIHGI